MCHEDHKPKGKYKAVKAYISLSEAIWIFVSYWEVKILSAKVTVLRM